MVPQRKRPAKDSGVLLGWESSKTIPESMWAFSQSPKQAILHNAQWCKEDGPSVGRMRTEQSRRVWQFADSEYPSRESTQESHELSPDYSGKGQPAQQESQRWKVDLRMKQGQGNFFLAIFFFFYNCAWHLPCTNAWKFHYPFSWLVPNRVFLPFPQIGPHWLGSAVHCPVYEHFLSMSPWVLC